jgi:hypothetical protein
METKRKKVNWKIILSCIAAFFLVEWLLIGYRFGFGPFKSLGDIRMRKLEGNASTYSMEHVTLLEGNPLQGDNICFLGSSVTYGAASLREGIPEYFAARFGCSVTKEAVSGTTLVDNGKSSYVQRMLHNLDPDAHYDLFVCQLSTNDATKELPLGEISDSMELNAFDTTTITGACEYIICYAKSVWNCPVVFYTGSRYDSETYDAMVSRLMELQEKWGIGVLDLWHSTEFNSIPDEKRALYMYDNIHPTKAGYRDWWCPEMERQIMKYLSE